ncbi:MAG: FAD-dependent oxidoreductase [Thomasclavelia sp.]
MKVLIVGGVASGATTAARLRRLDKDVEIVILEKGNYVSYANCGLPYYVSGKISPKEQLLLMTPKLFKERFDVTVKVANEAIKIDSENKKVTVYDHLNKEKYQESYDKLVIATGSSPISLPVPGIDHPKIQQLWTINDFDKIKQKIILEKVKSVAIIGGGFVGIETAENLKNLGIEVDIIEKSNQILNNLDFEMVQPIHKYITQKGIKLFLNTELLGFEDGNEIKVKTNQFDRNYDLVILSIGVTPNSYIAKEAGVLCNERGGIVVDHQLQTNIKDIYAVGDVIEVEHLVSHQKVMIPLAGPANKQGRILADNLLGNQKSYHGSLGSSIIKVFDLIGASTGLNEKQLQANGLKRHQDYQVVLIEQKSHAGYYPGATPLVLKVIYDHDGYLLGAQVIGYEGVDKRIDIIATAINYHGKITDLQDIHVAYAPPFAQAKDAINMAGYVGENINNGYLKLMLPDEYQQIKDQVITLDVREDIERQENKIENSYHIPYGELSKRYQELDQNKPIVIYCAAGVRAYNCARILMHRGYQEVYVLSGGLSFYQDYCFTV